MSTHGSAALSKPVAALLALLVYSRYSRYSRHSRYSRYSRYSGRGSVEKPVGAQAENVAWLDVHGVCSGANRAAENRSAC
jgi:hypothetical protein